MLCACSHCVRICVYVQAYICVCMYVYLYKPDGICKLVHTTITDPNTFQHIPPTHTSATRVHLQHQKVHVVVQVQLVHTRQV